MKWLLASLSLVLLCGFQAPVEKKDRYFYEKRGEVIWEVPLNEKKIALTFDDGPYPETTEPILDLLKEYDAKATFFVLGNRVRKYPDLLRREAQEGHEIANHTFNHIYFRGNTNLNTIEDEIVRTEELLVELTGKKPFLFRPPGGFYNDNTIQVAKKLGYQTVLWSWHQDTNDWRKPGVNNIVKKVLGNARNGDIVLLHDYTPSSTQTVTALRTILPELKKRGFKIVTVSELINGEPDESIPLQQLENIGRSSSE
ncbi:polysaccharide deacetylase family protein [Paenibacillus gorillae]|uniref:polysaccharide deacetylase family protein n=1 Tax=Paenibacillus gorillae TaxID=1243662 RepID=UPI0004BA18DC|nr:polysaccharide deacetylase family protein [Paenibacillus gorillae]